MDELPRRGSLRRVQLRLTWKSLSNPRAARGGERRDNYDLVLQVDRASGQGTRQLFDDEQQAIKGQGGTDAISCTRQP